jgi:outer membrane scaffolding protein for murein synthesis (MipA/OmpV family)
MVSQQLVKSVSDENNLFKKATIRFKIPGWDDRVDQPFLTRLELRVHRPRGLSLMKVLPFILTALILGGMSSLALAESGDKNWSGMLGLTALYKPQYIGDDDEQVTGAPIIVVDYKDTFYFNIDRGGWWFWKPNDAWRAGALLQIRQQAWDSDDGHLRRVKPLPNNFDDPDTGAEPGLNARYKMDRFTAEAQVTSGEDTNMKLDFKYNLMQTEQIVVIANVGVEYLGEDEVNYQWYGDKGSLDNDSATNLYLGVSAIQTLNPNWKLLYGVKTTSLDDEIEDSPVGQDDTYTVISLGGAYSF